MIVATAKAVKKAGAHFLRGGAFKPLTFPYRGPKFFELREEGLRLLQIAKREAAIPVITEMMHVDKVDAVAETADILQIGTRNMQNYPLARSGRQGRQARDAETAFWLFPARLAGRRGIYPSRGQPQCDFVRARGHGSPYSPRHLSFSVGFAGRPSGPGTDPSPDRDRSLPRNVLETMGKTDGAGFDRRGC